MSEERERPICRSALTISDSGALGRNEEQRKINARLEAILASDIDRDMESQNLKAFENWNAAVRKRMMNEIARRGVSKVFSKSSEVYWKISKRSMRTVDTLKRKQVVESVESADHTAVSDLSRADL